MRIGIAAITSTALVGGTLVAVPAHPLLPVTAVAQAQEAPFATATGQVIDLSLFRDSVDPADQDAFLELLDAIRADAQFPGNEADSASIDVSLLENIDLNLAGVRIALTDLLGIEGAAGVLGANASTPAGNEAFASAGALNDDGSIDLSAHSGTGGVETVLNLTNILQGSGIDAVTDQVIDELSLRVGAVSASAERDGDEVISEYALANVGVNLTSPLIQELTGALISEDATTPGLGIQVDNLVDQVAGEQSLVSGLTGVLGSVLTLLENLTLGVVAVDEPTIELGTDIQGTLEALLGQTITSASGAVSIDLTNGEISIDVDALGGTSAVDPNTNLLDDEAIEQISLEINTLLQGLLDNVDDAINEGILNTSVTVQLGASLLGSRIADITLDGTLNQFLTGDPSTINIALFGYSSPTLQSALTESLGAVGTLVRGAIDEVVDPLLDTVFADLLGDIVAPLTGGLSELLADNDVLSITLNDQPNPQVVADITRGIPDRPNAATAPITNPDDAFTVSALRINVLNGVIDLPLARATVNADATWSDVEAPSIADITDQTVVVGEEIDEITPVATPDDAVIEVIGLPDGVTFTGGVISGAPTAPGTSEVTVTATNAGGTATRTFSITATPIVVEAPSIAPIANQTVTVGQPIDDVAPAVTPSDAEVTVADLPAGVTFENGVISGAPTEAGTSVVTVTAANAGGTTSTTFTITANPVVADDPTIAGIDDQTINLGDAIAPITPVATPDEAVIDVDGLPDGVTFTGGVISGAPTAAGSADVTVTATNAGVTVSTTFTITTNPVAGPDAPTIADIDDQTVTLGEPITSITPDATPDDTDIEVDGLPVGVTFAGGIISGIPAAVGTSVVTVTATNATGSASVTFRINVEAVAVEDPTIDNIADQTVTVGENIDEITPVATPDDAVIEVIGLPEGVSFENGVISGVPTTVGEALITVTAAVGTAVATTTFTITTNPAAVDGAPVITPIDDQDGIVGDEIDPIDVDVTPGDSDVEVEGLPDGLDYNPDTGVIDGTPAEGTEGTHTVIVTATNDAGTDTETFVITITDGTTPVPPVDNGSANGSSEFLQQCLDSPAAGVVGLLVALGAVSAIAGPALEPLLKSIGGEIDRQLRNMASATAGAHQPEWVRNINQGLNDAANAVNHQMVSNALFASAALALVSAPILCGTDNNSSSSS